MSTHYVVGGAGAAAIAALVIVMNTSYRIPELKVVEERPLGIVVEYQYPKRDKRDYLLGLLTSGSSLIFRKENGDWNSYTNNVIVFESHAPLNLIGKSFLPFSAPNTPYMIVKNGNRRTIRVKQRYSEHEYRNFRVISESKYSEQIHDLLLALDNHLTKLSSDTKIKFLPFDVLMVDLPIPSMILNDNRMIIGNKDRVTEMIHEFAHVISKFNNHKVLEAAVHLFKDPNRFAESRYLDTKVGHPHSNLSEMITSIITLYILGRTVELEGKDAEMYRVIVSHYRLDELRGDIVGIVGKR